MFLDIMMRQRKSNHQRAWLNRTTRTIINTYVCAVGWRRIDLITWWNGNGQGDVSQFLMKNAGMFAAFNLSQKRERQVHDDLRLVVTVEIFLQLCQSFPDGQKSIVFRHDNRRRPSSWRIPTDVVFFTTFQQTIRRASRRQRLTSRWYQSVEFDLYIQLLIKESGIVNNKLTGGNNLSVVLWSEIQGYHFESKMVLLLQILN